MRPERYVGLMSGTSLDGVDAVLAEFSDEACHVIGAVARRFPPALRAELLALQSPGDNELARAARAANALADVYAESILELLASTSTPAADVAAAGVHGQTLRHRPEEGWTLQLNNPARVAERTGVTVAADFRSRDVAAGGQGAPLVPAFHAARFRQRDTHRAVVNIGGIANVTDLPPALSEAPVRGFDTGPGNVFLDLWCAAHRGEPFDREGAWARSGKVDDALLAAMLADVYFAAHPPKSTGRDRFNQGWLDAQLAARKVLPVDVQATLLALTARTIAGAIGTYCPGVTEVLLCGGGANNAALRDALGAELAHRPVTTTATYGVAVEHVEALAFAWLAREVLAGRPGNLPAVTGASGLRVLGAVYPR